jgi:hypothetical protein
MCQVDWWYWSDCFNLTVPDICVTCFMNAWGTDHVRFLVTNLGEGAAGNDEEEQGLPREEEMPDADAGDDQCQACKHQMQFADPVTGQAPTRFGAPGRDAYCRAIHLLLHYHISWKACRSHLVYVGGRCDDCVRLLIVNDSMQSSIVVELGTGLNLAEIF